MLKKNKKKESIVERNSSNRNVIGKGTKITGDLISEGDFRIDGEFEGTCASQNPHLNKEGEDCGYCGKSADEMCKNEA